MRQFNTRWTKSAIDALKTGPAKVRAANRIMYAEKAAKARDFKRSRNAYRRAVDLPEIP